MTHERITSTHNPRIKAAAKLRNREDRESQGRTILDGGREISRALDAKIEIVELFYCDELLRAESRPVIERVHDGEIRVSEVSRGILEKLTFGQRNEGIVAVAHTPRRSLADLQLPTNPLVAILAQVEKPGNVGAIVRSGDAAGVNAIIVADGSTDVFNPNAIRASLGTIFALPVLAASASQTLDWLRANRIRLFAARVGAEQSYTEADFTGPTALILGSEAHGLGASWIADDVVPISLPVVGVGDSLNVSVTAGVLFYEALRQRRRSSSV